ncbi:MAG: glutathione S-transferase [Gammaproteobacteria bacterium]|nr:glutathione S-transferase [Gammaproteobacteria bacterium]
MPETDIRSLVDAANARYTDPERNVIINGVPGQTPRFELYHFSLSLCSMKVRGVFAEKEAAYTSHDIDILPPGMQNYFPEYARLRLAGGRDLVGNMVNGYTGRSSTETEGFDPLVVPTLVDHEAGKILVNSKKMCLYLDAEIDTGTRLVPTDIAAAVIRQVDIVDQTPHPAVLYGSHPDGDNRPDFIQHDMPGIHDRKIAEARHNMAQVGNDPLLISAYEHKILKESAAKAHVNDVQKMRASVQEFKDIVGQLEKDLSHGDEWIMGERFTLADVVWAVSLFRIQWLGLGYIWKAGDDIVLPRVHEYTKRTFARPSFVAATIRWPRNPPSPHVMEYYQ